MAAMFLWQGRRWKREQILQELSRCCRAASAEWIQLHDVLWNRGFATASHKNHGDQNKDSRPEQQGGMVAQWLALPHVCVGFLWVLRLPTTVKRCRCVCEWVFVWISGVSPNVSWDWLQLRQRITGIDYGWMVRDLNIIRFMYLWRFSVIWVIYYRSCT